MSTGSKTHQGESTPWSRSDLGADSVDQGPVPGLLVAWRPPGCIDVQCVGLSEAGVTIGRGTEADWMVSDARLSKRHATFRVADGEVVVTDLGSTNGTYLQGQRLEAETEVVAEEGEVLRCGRCVFVVNPDVRSFSKQPSTDDNFGMAGPFYSPKVLSSLVESATIGRHILLSGASGTGKELAAHALSAMLASRNQSNGMIVAHNCARFANEEEATTTLFGVGRGVFSGVDARPGLLEQAEGGVLYLDEVHLLPARVQRSLLRFAEDEVFSRIGETKQRQLGLTLILGSNQDVEQAKREGRLAADLLNRLQHRHIPPLNERRADVPDIFFHHLGKVCIEQELDVKKALPSIKAGHVEAICLLDLSEQNVRELIHLAEALVARVEQKKTDAGEALGELLPEFYPENPVVQRSTGVAPKTQRRTDTRRSRYERNRDTIISVYRQVDGNVSELERVLNERGLRVNRRWLSSFLEKWGER